MIDFSWWLLEVFFYYHVLIFFIADFLIFTLILILFIIVIIQKKKIKKMIKKTNEQKQVVTSVEEKIQENDSVNSLEKNEKIEFNDEKNEKIEFNDEKIEEDEISFLVSQLTNQKAIKDETSEVDTVATIDIHVDDILQEINESKKTEQAKKDNEIEKTLDNLVYIKKCLVEKIKKYNEEVKVLEFIEDQKLKETKKNEILKNLKIVKIELEEFHTLEKEVLKIVEGE